MLTLFASESAAQRPRRQPQDVIRNGARGPCGLESFGPAGARSPLQRSVGVVEKIEELVRLHDPHTLPPGCIEEVLVALNDDCLVAGGTQHELVVVSIHRDRLGGSRIGYEIPVSNDQGQNGLVFEALV